MIWAWAFVAVAVALLGAAVWGLSRVVAGLCAQLAVLTLVVHEVRDQMIALNLVITRPDSGKRGGQEKAVIP